MAAPPPSQPHDSELLLSRPRAALPRRGHFIALLVMSSIEVLCDTCAPYTMLVALTTFIDSTQSQVSTNIMWSAFVWVLVNLVLHTMSRLGCCVLTSVHLTQGRFWTVEKQV
jgi:uncharacterized membrane protein YbhN (UPF0104 family)